MKTLPAYEAHPDATERTDSALGPRQVESRIITDQAREARSWLSPDMSGTSNIGSLDHMDWLPLLRARVAS